MGKFIAVCLTIVALFYLSGIFPVVAVSLTAIVIVLGFLILNAKY